MPPIQYYGKLLKSDTNELVVQYPVLRVIVDKDGNWPRIMNRLKANNLKFDGGKVPSSSAADGSVRELIASLLPDHPEIDPNFSLPKPLGYNALMLQLEQLELVTPMPSGSRGRSGTDKSVSLSRAHRSKVQAHVRKVNKSDLVANPGHDGLEQAPSLEIPEGMNNDLNPHDLFHEPADNVFDSPDIQVPPSQEVSDGQAAAALGEHLQEALSEKQKLIEELNTERVKNSQLENQLVQANGGLLADQERLLRDLLTESMSTMTESLTRHISTEIGAAITARIDELRDDLGAIHTIKDTTETCLNKVVYTSEYLDEVMDSFNKTSDSLIIKVDSLNQAVSASKVSLDSLPQVRTQVSSISARLTEALKQLFPASPYSTHSHLPPTPNKTPLRKPPGPPVSKCYECGGPHLRRECPAKNDFCVRCLKVSDHKHWLCPAIQECCPICRDSGLGSAAYGHTKYVHDVSDWGRRDQICKILSKACFPSWFGNGKRKHEI